MLSWSCPGACPCGWRCWLRAVRPIRLRSAILLVTSLSVSSSREEDPERKSAALAGALPRLLNQDLLAAVTPPDRARVMFDWLRRMPFVSTRAKSWAYHEVVRAAMLRLQRAQAPRQWQSDHEALARANERWAQEAAGQSSPAWDNPRWADYFREAMYHLLCADPDNNLDRVLALAEEAAAHSGARARQWAELLADAARDADAPGLNRYAQYLSDSIRSSELVLYSRRAG